jgi:hypothetical protein
LLAVQQKSPEGKKKEKKKAAVKSRKSGPGALYLYVSSGKKPLLATLHIASYSALTKERSRWSGLILRLRQSDTMQGKAEKRLEEDEEEDPAAYGVPKVVYAESSYCSQS